MGGGGAKDYVRARTLRAQSPKFLEALGFFMLSFAI